MATASLPPGKVIALALVANLLVGTAGAYIVAPVATSGAAVGLYDGLPEPLRRILGDSEEVGEDGAERPARGPVGGWLAGFYEEALRADRHAQLVLEPDLSANVPVSDWSGAEDVTVTWPVFGAGFTYEVFATGTAAEPAPGAPVTATADPGSVTLRLGEGKHFVHVRARDGADAGPFGTIGPFWLDPSPPEPPRVGNGGHLTVGDFHFTVKWTRADDVSGIEGYELERSLNGERYATVAVLDGETTEHRERNRPNGDYWYRIVAVNGGGVRSAPSEPLRVTVDARSNLAVPDSGSWHIGVNATYDSVIHLWDISDPSVYLDLADFSSGASPAYGGLSEADYTHYTGPGWGIALENETLRQIVADELGADWQGNGLVGGEDNTLVIGMRLFEWLFNATDYDFDKFNAPDGQDFLRSNEVLDRGLGICGDLTSLYITMMRIAGVPARPVHGYLINNDEGIGGFHMWAEIYVGGQDNDPTGGGWIPVDVSGVTGEFSPEFLSIYFGVANPSYLQLGIQRDLGSEDDPEDPANTWNVWANLRFSYFQNGGQPDVTFDADAKVSEVASLSEAGRLWFDPTTNDRRFCAVDDDGCSTGFNQYFDGLRSRSVREIDYGADIGWTSSNLNEITLRLKFPENPAPNQVTIFTTYLHNKSCVANTGTGDEMPDGFLEWTVQGEQAPCSG